MEFVIQFFLKCNNDQILPPCSRSDSGLAAVHSYQLWYDVTGHSRGGCSSWNQNGIRLGPTALLTCSVECPYCACQIFERVRRAKATRRCPVRNTAVSRSIVSRDINCRTVSAHISTCPHLSQSYSVIFLAFPQPAVHRHLSLTIGSS